MGENKTKNAADFRTSEVKRAFFYIKFSFLSSEVLIFHVFKLLKESC